eukprot:Protomagalhaensia_sp_Gyna_25__1182@NODE_1585_length_1711_cov_33_242225_g1291_i0_p1_GENE_NODE_1585_length_1711_cov_33_242225_g1291_i0NODE_1585_length_1711_cov_33_242225_g1291_i0_p1_ORF_typecomplete_len387_score49_28_NODE_1585_length_1711_cov_33_242225_g1291_i01641324
MTRCVRNEAGPAPITGYLAAVTATCAGLPWADSALSIVFKAALNPEGESVLKERGIEVVLKGEWQWIDVNNVSLPASNRVAALSSDEPEPLEPTGETELRRVWVPAVTEGMINLMDWKQLQVCKFIQYLTLNEQIRPKDFPFHVLAGNPALFILEDGVAADSLKVVEFHNIESKQEGNVNVVKAKPDQVLFLHRKWVQDRDYYTPLVKQTTGQVVSYKLAPRHYSLFEAVAIAARAAGDCLGEDRRSRRISRLKLAAAAKILATLNLSEDEHAEDFRETTVALLKDLDPLQDPSDSAAPKGFKEVLRSVDVGIFEGRERTVNAWDLEGPTIILENNLSEFCILTKETAALETSLNGKFMTSQLHQILRSRLQQNKNQIREMNIWMA